MISHDHAKPCLKDADALPLRSGFLPVPAPGKPPLRHHDRVTYAVTVDVDLPKGAPELDVLQREGVGFLLRMSEHPLDLEVAAMVSKAARQIEKLGAHVEEIDAPPFPHAEAGKSCGTNQVCDGSGSCVACTAGGACGTTCKPGTFSCSTGVQACAQNNAMTAEKIGRTHSTGLR